MLTLIIIILWVLCILIKNLIKNLIKIKKITLYYDHMRIIVIYYIMKISMIHNEFLLIIEWIL